MKSIFLIWLLFPLVLNAQPEIIWKRAVGGKISGWQAEGSNGNLYLLSEDRGLHALDVRTGVDLWRYRPGGELVNFLAVSPDGLVFVQNDRGDIDAINPEGQALWRCSLGHLSTLLPLVTQEGTLILLMEQGSMTAISRQGEILWTTQLPDQPSSSAVMDLMGTLYVPFKQGGIGLYNRDGTFLYRLQSSVLTGIILDSQGILYGATAGGRVYAWYEGSELWNSGTEPGEYSSLLLRNEELLMILKNGLIYRINQSGAEGYFQGPQPVFPSIITESGKILLVDKSNTLWVLDLDSEVQQHYPLPELSSLPLLSSEGFLILGGMDWKIYAYKMEPPMEGWAQYRGNAARNGTLFSVISPEHRLELYKDNPLYREFRYLIETEEVDNQQAILDKIEAIQSWAQLNDEIPFWDISLLELAGNGINYIVMRDGQAVKTSPLIRANAYRLLRQWDVHYLRPYIIGALRSERDPLVLSEGYKTLGELGADWDGQSVALIDKTLQLSRNPSDRQISSAAEAYLNLLKWGGEKQSLRALSALYRLLDMPMSPQTMNHINLLMDEYMNL